jgi:DUF971 family protein
MSVKYQDVAALDVYTEALRIASRSAQTIGEKHDYYITVAQLEAILKSLTE